MKTVDKKIKEIIKTMGGVGSKYLKEWNGYSVYNIEYTGTVFGGYPLVILVKDSDARLSTPEECIDFWGILSKIKK